MDWCILCVPHSWSLHSWLLSRPFQHHPCGLHHLLHSKFFVSSTFTFPLIKLYGVNFLLFFFLDMIINIFWENPLVRSTTCKYSNMIMFIFTKKLCCHCYHTYKLTVSFKQYLTPVEFYLFLCHTSLQWGAISTRTHLAACAFCLLHIQNNGGWGVHCIHIHVHACRLVFKPTW